MSSRPIDIEAAALLSAFAHPTRICLLRQLLRGGCCVGDLTENAQCLQPKVSRHLGILRDAGLVEALVDGRKRTYRLTRPDLVTAVLGLVDDA